MWPRRKVPDATVIELHNLVNEVFALRSRAHETHISTEHVPQLREFVEMVVAKEFSDFGKTAVVLAAERRVSVLLRVDTH